MFGTEFYGCGVFLWVLSVLQVVTVNYVKNDEEYSLVINENTITTTGPDGTNTIPITEEKSNIGGSELNFSTWKHYFKLGPLLAPIHPFHLHKQASKSKEHGELKNDRNKEQFVKSKLCLDACGLMQQLSATAEASL